MPSGIGGDVGCGDDYPPLDSDLSYKNVNGTMFLLSYQKQMYKKK